MNDFNNGLWVVRVESEEVEDAAHPVTRLAGGLRARSVIGPAGWCSSAAGAARRRVRIGRARRRPGAPLLRGHPRPATPPAGPRRPRPRLPRVRGERGQRPHRAGAVRARWHAVERERRIGTNPTELAGPHGLYVSPDGRWYYVSTAHGTPERRALEVLDRDRRAGRPRRAGPLPGHACRWRPAGTTPGW